ncbi:hypothetical protein ACTXT7_004922 [Hymenolepis weldensis]
MQYEILEIYKNVKKRDFKHATYTIQNLEEKAFTEDGVIGFKSSRVFKSFAVLDQTPEAESFKFYFCNFLTKIFLHDGNYLGQYCLDFLEISYSGFICSKSAKLKEAWLRLFRKVITRSRNELLKLTIPENYVKQFFDQLASKQAQAVTGALCSTLAAVISSTPTTDLRERFHSFLTKLLAEKLSYGTKKAEFVIISAVSSSIAKLLQSADVKPKQEDADKFFGYSLQILLADLDKISQYKSIKSACKLLSASCKHVSSCDWSKAQAVIAYLQNLTNHKNFSLASTARDSYIALLKFVSKSDSISDDEIKLILNKVIPFLTENFALEALPTKLLSFRLKGLSILLPLYVKHSANHDSTQILALTVQEISRMASEISNNPAPPLAYCLTDLLDALLNLLTKLPEMRESLVDSLKLGIISCFQAYPRLSQASTESIARALIKIIEKMAGDKDMLAILNEAYEYFYALPYPPLTIEAIKLWIRSFGYPSKLSGDHFVVIVYASQYNSKPNLRMCSPTLILDRERYHGASPLGITSAVCHSAHWACADGHRTRDLWHGRRTCRPLRHRRTLANLDFYHIVLQTCSHSPFDLDASESDDDDSNEAEKDAGEDSFEKSQQPNVSSQPEVAIPLPSIREYLPLWRYLLGLPTGIRKKENHKFIPKHCSALVLRFLLNSSLVIVKRLDFSYNELSTNAIDFETQIDIKTPHDVLLLSNIAAFLEIKLTLVAWLANDCCDGFFTGGLTHPGGAWESNNPLHE